MKLPSVSDKNNKNFKKKIITHLIDVLFGNLLFVITSCIKDDNAVRLNLLVFMKVFWDLSCNYGDGNCLGGLGLGFMGSGRRANRACLPIASPAISNKPRGAGPISALHLYIYIILERIRLDDRIFT